MPPDTVKAQYNYTSGVEKVFVENEGNTHIDATGWSYQGLGCGACPKGSGGADFRGPLFGLCLGWVFADFRWNLA